MRGKILLSFVFVIFAITILVFYWFVPFSTTEFWMTPDNSNFSLESYGKDNMQFYPNMRYPDYRISYKIDDCPLQKKYDMERAFGILEDKSILEFYPTEVNQEITVTCDSKTKMEGGLFIAGKGGPTNITVAGNFNVILNGKVLLIRDSQCATPNVAIHELLHALGFDHSDNPSNIMYAVSSCEQSIGEDTIELINEIYAFPSYPDLVFENVTAQMHGKYLSTNFSVRNNGLAEAGEAEVLIFADDKLVKEIEIDSLDIGYGVTTSLNNVWVSALSVEELKFVIDSDFAELVENNNEIKLEIKK